MSHNRIKAAAIAALLALTLCSCGNKTENGAPSAAAAPAETSAAETSAPETTAAPEETVKVYDKEANILNADLTGGFDRLRKHFQIADGWSNGSMFNCTWRETNCSFEGEKMTLTIDNDTAGSNPPYSASEFRTKEFFGYGYYETTMKPISNNGVVSSFFTYTGPSDNNPWDEIDIEFLGKDTKTVQFNYYTNGVGNHEYIYDLGFDAAEDFHSYGFDWKEDSITWYVDGEAVYTATENIPVTPSKIMMNVWPGKGVDAWLSPFDGTVPLSAEYTKIYYTAAGK